MAERSAPAIPTTSKIQPTVVSSTPLTVTSTAQIRIAPAATSRRLSPIPIGTPFYGLQGERSVRRCGYASSLRSPHAEAAVGAVAPRIHPAGRRNGRVHLLRRRGRDAGPRRRARTRAPEPVPVLVGAPARCAAPPRRRVRRPLGG